MTEILGVLHFDAPYLKSAKFFFSQTNVKRLRKANCFMWINKNKGVLLHIFLINILQKNFILAFTVCWMNSCAITEAVLDKTHGD